MCGIAGFVDRSISNDNVIVKMTTSLNHRGPDAQDVFRDPHLPIQLGHARLAIIDLSSSGLQPMHSKSERFTIVFNGEIYNHQALRSAIEEDSSITWRGTSDTETLIACIERWGLIKTLNSLHGMFAFALLDRRDESITLARDRFGEKPLYYQKTTTGLCFGSELSAILSHPNSSKEPCEHAAHKLLTHQAIPAPLSALKNVYKLLPGTWLSYKMDGSIDTERWWSNEKCRNVALETPFTGSFEEAVSTLENVLGDAVDRQMISDVPLGAFLSGGIDSSLIVALMQARSQKPVNTFSIGFNDPKYNEAKEAKRVANALGTLHTEYYVTENDVVSVVSSLGDVFSEPLADPSQIPTIMVSEMAKKHVTVALTGDAGDEVFGGYNRHIFASNAWPQVRKVPAFVRNFAVNTVRKIPEPAFNKVASKMPIARDWTRPYEMLHRAGPALTATNVNELYNNAVTKTQRPLLNPEFYLNYSEKNPDLSSCPQSTIIEHIESNNYHNSPADWMMLMDQSNYLSDDILAKIDRASMSASLETRVPFLDQDVVNFSWTLPPEMRINGRHGKVILRDLLYRYVPKDLVDRPKMGFSIPIHNLLRGRLEPWASHLLSDSSLASTQLFSKDLVKTAWHSHKNGSSNNIEELWPVLMYQAWYESWLA